YTKPPMICGKQSAGGQAKEGKKTPQARRLACGRGKDSPAGFGALGGPVFLHGHAAQALDDAADAAIVNAEPWVNLFVAVTLEAHLQDFAFLGFQATQEILQMIDERDRLVGRRIAVDDREQPLIRLGALPQLGARVALGRLMEMNLPE